MDPSGTSTKPVVAPLISGHLDTTNVVVVETNPVNAYNGASTPSLIQGYITGTENEVVVNNISARATGNENVPSEDAHKQAATTVRVPKDYVELLRQRKRELEQVLHPSSPLPAIKSRPSGLSRLLGPKEIEDEDEKDAVVSYTNFSKASRQYNVHIVSDMSDISCSEWELDAEDETDRGHLTSMDELETASTAMEPQIPQKQFPTWQPASSSSKDDSIPCDTQDQNNLRSNPPVDSNTRMSSETCHTQSTGEETSSDKVLQLTSKSSASSKSSQENDFECAMPIRNSTSADNDLELALRKQPSLSFLGTDNTTLTADSTATAALRMRRSLIWMVACLSLLVVVLVITVSVVTIVALRNRDQHQNNSNNSLSSPATPMSVPTNLRPTASPMVHRDNIFLQTSASSPPPVTAPTNRLLIAKPAPPKQTHVSYYYRDKIYH